MKRTSSFHCRDEAYLRDDSLKVMQVQEKESTIFLFKDAAYLHRQVK
jgi:hypothetical protein